MAEMMRLSAEDVLKRHDKALTKKGTLEVYTKNVMSLRYHNVIFMTDTTKVK